MTIGNNKKEGEKRTAMETLLGSDLLTGIGKNAPTSTVMKDKELALLYFRWVKWAKDKDMSKSVSINPS